MTPERTRIEPCESRGNYVLDIRIGDRWEPLLHVGYVSVLQTMQKKIETALRTERRKAMEECAGIADDCDKSTHPREVADRIRAAMEAEAK